MKINHKLNALIFGRLECLSKKRRTKTSIVEKSKRKLN